MYYDLEDRIKDFSKKIIRLLKKIKINEINRNIILQLALELIIVKLITQAQRKILEIRYLSVVKKSKKLNIG